MKAYSYTRFSSSRQAAGASVARQEAAAQRWASTHGLDLDDTHRDAGKSAYTGKHHGGALGEFLLAVKRGQIPPGSVLIIEAVDRLSREHVLDALDILRQIVKAGISLVTLEDEKTYTWENIDRDASLWPVLSGKMQQARIYSQRLAMRVQDGKARARAEKLAAGVAISTTCPGWLRVRNGKYEVIPERVEIVRRIFAEFAADVSKERIALNLNRDKVPPFDRTGQGTGGSKYKSPRGWYTTSILKIVTNRAVIGEFQPTRRNAATGGKREADGAPVPGYYPAIIDRGLFERLQTRTKTVGRRGLGFANVLTGIAKCSHCGSAMLQKKSGDRWRADKLAKGKPLAEYHYLVCVSAKKAFNRDGTAICENRAMVNYHDVEDAVVAMATRLVDAKEFEVEGQHDVAAKAEVDAAVAAQADAETRLANIVNIVGRNPSSVMVKVMFGIEQEVEELTVKRREVEARSRKVKSKVEDTDYQELEKLLAKSRREADPAKKYAIRERIHGILHRTVDELLIDAPAKGIEAWLGGGRLHVLVAGGNVTRHIVCGSQMLHLDHAGRGIALAIPTPPAILEKHLKLTRGETITRGPNGLDRQVDAVLVDLGLPYVQREAAE